MEKLIERMKTKKRMKERATQTGGSMIRTLWALVLIALVGSMAQAITTDTVTLTVTPVFNLSVNISSATNTFGSNVVLCTSKTICVGQIANDGNVTSKWQKLTGNAGSAGTAWTLATTGMPGTNQFRLLAISTGVATDPTYATGNASNACIDGDHQVIGVTGAATDLTEQGTNTLGVSHIAGETKKLWASLMMPTNVTTSGEQTITLSIVAVIP